MKLLFLRFVCKLLLLNDIIPHSLHSKSYALLPSVPLCLTLLFLNQGDNLLIMEHFVIKLSLFLFLNVFQYFNFLIFIDDLLSLLNLKTAFLTLFLLLLLKILLQLLQVL